VNAHGYKPLVPIIASQFADAKMRNGWIRDKEEYAHALVKPLQGSVDVRFVSIATLIDMKTAAGRQQDLIDVEHQLAQQFGSERP
jgi:hypothetical protein